MGKEKKKDGKDTNKSRGTLPAERSGKTANTDPSSKPTPKYHYTDAL